MPLTLEQHEKKLLEPALCEQLAVRDYLDDVVVRTSGSFVAGYALKGLTSYFASDEGKMCIRDRTSSVESQASTNTVNKSPTIAVTIEAARNSTDSDDLDRASISKMFQLPQQVDCKSGTYSCGTGCCSSDQQCCMNKDTSGHYCATKCE